MHVDFISYLGKQTMWIYLIVIIVIYRISHSKLCSDITEINQFEHHTNHDANTYELEAISGIRGQERILTRFTENYRRKFIFVMPWNVFVSLSDWLVDLTFLLVTSNQQEGISIEWQPLTFWQSVLHTGQVWTFSGVGTWPSAGLSLLKV